MVNVVSIFKKMWVVIKQEWQPILISGNNCYIHYTNPQFILISHANSSEIICWKMMVLKEGGWRVCSSPSLLERGVGIVSLWNRILGRMGPTYTKDPSVYFPLTDRLAQYNEGLLLTGKERTNSGEASPDWESWIQGSLGAKNQRLLY